MADELCPITLEDLNKPSDCEGNVPGVVAVLYALKDDILTWPTKKTPETRTSLSDYVNTTSDNIVMKPGKRFFGFYFKKATGEIRYDIEGESGSKSIKGSVEVDHPGLKANLLGFLSAVKNEEIVVLAKASDKKWHQFGDEDEGAEIESAALTSGKAKTDANGGPIVISKSGMNAPTIYTGDIDHLKVVAGDGSGSAS